MSLQGFFKGFPSEAAAAVLEASRDGAASDPGLSIKAAGSADAMTSGFSFRLGGRIYSKAAIATLSLAALGAVAAGGSRTAFITIKADGTVAVAVVSPDSHGVVRIPKPAAGSCLLGAVTVANGSGATFTAGVTALDAAGLTVTYVGLSGCVPGEAL
ncbi:hypothetical protein [Solidesulfovibrio magneticus]|uniref:Uncharacterized protein n=1 Tax=Solidesulfovibrio magneticus (strain ATCC 700980 / DSM 13731 / RS-1) TaxID=573370 RepID=C4XTJ8_SOLM1|nr:hypothetical protein [Solidesulfovibrio magneticus]BAH75995.1 hypothetical protein DMR_25040 [Solidesulfovibrio magneticus RS-1]